MLPMLARTQYQGRMQESRRYLLTIHNIAFQGKFGFDYVQDLLGVDARFYTPEFMELNGCADFLKAGCVFADRINTVSPSYAEEIQERMGLEVRADVPLIAMVTRMTEQKGFDLVARVIDDLMGNDDVQFMLLGSGDERFENIMRAAEGRYRGRLCAYIGYSEPLSHLVYAASDFFLMPSRFEPCGLSQMIAMRYGSLPIVRETGGLRDTVAPYNKYTGEGNGFSFANFDAYEMLGVIRSALGCYGDREIMRGLISRAMQADYGFDGSAEEYAKLYIWML